MKMNMIEVDDIIMEYLKKNAEPFSDTPNSVLHKLLFGDRNNKVTSFIATSSNPRVPRALSQTMDVIQEVIMNRLTRQDATRIVAERSGTAAQTVIDKYCRQLGKTASEVDHLLQEPGLESLKIILKNKFSMHRDLIDEFFRTLSSGRTEQQSFSSPASDLPNSQPVVFRRHSSVSSGRKKRDIPLENALKAALGSQLRSQFGVFAPEGQSQLIFNDVRLLCKFSSFHNDQSRWFWGVSKTFWENWEDMDYLALIFENENENGSGYSYLLLDSEESLQLFSQCSESNGEKKINMRIYMDDGSFKLQEWKDFDVRSRIKTLTLIYK